MNKNENNNKISIIMGIFNCADTLPEAIDSILAQTYTNWELIMCDDASTDDTFVIAKMYADRFPKKIILIKNENNMKLAYSLNHCLKYATGDYIARMDGDDISLPERFERELEYLQAHPEYDLVGCAMQRFDDDGLADIVYSVDNPDYYTLKNSLPYHHATILARREVFDILNGYTMAERTNRAQDYDLWFRFYHEGFKGNNLKEVLYFVREDRNAIRRRTFRVRWNAYKTTKYGYTLLGYPKRWLFKAFCTTLFKSLVPYFCIDWYRTYQKRKVTNC